MYGFEMAVAGCVDDAFETGVVETLASMGVVVRARVETSWAARYEWARSLVPREQIEHTTLAMGEVDGVARVDLRGLRHPAHGLSIAQSLSRRSLGLAGVMINDRLTDHYGLGFFFGGFALESSLGVRTMQEEQNLTTWRATTRAFGIETTRPLKVRALALACADGRDASALDARYARERTPAWRATVPNDPICCAAIVVDESRADALAEDTRRRGWRVEIVPLDETCEALLLASSSQRPDALVEALDCTATVTYFSGDAIEAWWRDAHDTTWTHERGRGVTLLARAWEPVRRASPNAMWRAFRCEAPHGVMGG